MANIDDCDKHEEYEERPHGEWIRTSSTVLFCKVCKNHVPDNTTYIPMNFCPICGSKNRWKEGEA